MTGDSVSKPSHHSNKMSKTKNSSKAQLDALIDAAVDAIIIADDKGCIELFSRSAEKIFGYTQGELIGKNLSSIMPPPYREAHNSYMNNYSETRQPKIIGIGRLVTAQRKDGSVFPIELSVGETIESDKVQYIGIIRDVSERVAIEREKERLLKKNQAILASISDLILELDSNNNITWANQKALVFFGSSLLNSPFSTIFNNTLIPDTSLAEKKKTHKNATSINFNDTPLTTFENIDQWHLNQSGQECLLDWHCQKIKSEQGNPSGMIAVARDKTADYKAHLNLQKAESEAREHRDKLAHVTRLSTLGEMAAGIAHEVNQPLTAISTYAQACHRLLRLSNTKTEVVIETLQKISHQAQRAGDIIHRMRKFVKYKSSMLEKVDVNELISEVLRLTDSDIDRNNIELKHTFFENAVFVSVDPVQIQQVVLNLIRNGIESINANTEPHNTRTINLQTSNIQTIDLQRKHLGAREIEVSVSDSGGGVNKETIGELFNPFFTTKSTGLGMGLSICQSIITAHHGEIKYSPNPKGGAIFSFTLPIALELDNGGVENE
ncbi:MAG: PAS domain S-box protein [Pseudomonadales bacterium]|nr:PAS domain S-box protein [Pseudomonadales bacterium]